MLGRQILTSNRLCSAARRSVRHPVRVPDFLPSTGRAAGYNEACQSSMKSSPTVTAHPPHRISGFLRCLQRSAGLQQRTCHAHWAAVDAGIAPFELAVAAGVISCRASRSVLVPPQPSPGRPIGSSPFSSEAIAHCIEPSAARRAREIGNNALLRAQLGLKPTLVLEHEGEASGASLQALGVRRFGANSKPSTRGSSPSSSDPRTPRGGLLQRERPSAVRELAPQAGYAGDRRAARGVVQLRTGESPQSLRMRALRNRTLGVQALARTGKEVPAALALHPQPATRSS